MANKRALSEEFPKALSNNLLVEEVAGELLVFDTRSNRAHCLNASAAAIWQHCDGTRSATSLASHLFPKLPAADGERLVTIGVERLRRRHLLEDDPSRAGVDLSKRELLKKVAIIATAAGIAAPLVSTVLAPSSAYALSCIPTGLMCTAPLQCCTQRCIDLMCVP